MPAMKRVSVFLNFSSLLNLLFQRRLFCDCPRPSFININSRHAGSIRNSFNCHIIISRKRWLRHQTTCTATHRLIITGLRPHGSIAHKRIHLSTALPWKLFVYFNTVNIYLQCGTTEAPSKQIEWMDLVILRDF